RPSATLNSIPMWALGVKYAEFLPKIVAAPGFNAPCNLASRDGFQHLSRLWYARFPAFKEHRPKMMRPTLLGLFAALIFAAPGVRAAEFANQPGAEAPAPQRGSINALSIAAVVNEDIISVYDVESRMGLVLATSGYENTPEVQRRLLPQVIDTLIE